MQPFLSRDLEPEASTIGHLNPESMTRRICSDFQDQHPKAQRSNQRAPGCHLALGCTTHRSWGGTREPASRRSWPSATMPGELPRPTPEPTLGMMQSSGLLPLRTRFTPQQFERTSCHIPSVGGRGGAPCSLLHALPRLRKGHPGYCTPPEPSWSASPEEERRSMEGSSSAAACSGAGKDVRRIWGWDFRCSSAAIFQRTSDSAVQYIALHQGLGLGSAKLCQQGSSLASHRLLRRNAS